MKKENFKHNRKNGQNAAKADDKTCFVTKETAPRSDMLRFVSSPDKTIIFDVTEKLPGHGFWLRADRLVLDQAVTKRLFCKVAKTTVKIPEDLSDIVETGLRERCLSMMALCRKAGLLVFGYEAVKKAIGQGKASVAFEATDASARGQNKIFRPDDSFPVYTFFGREDLGRIAGLDEVVHIALLTGALSTGVMVIARKLSLYLGAQQQKG